jgi:hypothetical protein
MVVGFDGAVSRGASVESASGGQGAGSVSLATAKRRVATGWEGLIMVSAKAGRTGESLCAG